MQRCLRISLLGHMAEEDSGAHRVCHMLLTSGQGPQRTQSSLAGSVAQLAGVAGLLSARSAQASADHGAASQHPEITPRDQLVSSAAAPPLTAHSAAPLAAAPAAAAPVVEQPAEEPQQSAGSSGARVPPLQLGSLISGSSGGAPAPPPAAAPAAAAQPQPAPSLEPCSAKALPEAPEQEVRHGVDAAACMACMGPGACAPAPCS